MQVQVAPSNRRWPGITTKLVVGTLLVAAALAPGFLWPAYFRALATLVFSALVILTLRTIATGIVTSRRPADPPAKPEGIAWPTVTVLVPAYNEATVLAHTMAAMRDLQYPPGLLEFVYVYEGRSTDGTGKIIREMAGNDSRFVIVERGPRDRPGKAAAFNDALQHCTGEILVSLDADQVPAPDAIDRVARWFLADPKLMCVKARPVGTNSRESALALMVKVERDMVERGETYARHVWRGFTFFGGGQVAFRRSLFSLMGGYSEDMLLEDIDYSLRLHEAGHNILVDPMFLTGEESPASLTTWWRQRRRWTRGGMQVAMRHLPRVSGMRGAPWSVRLDILYTLVFSLLPALFVLTLPMAGLGWMGVRTQTYFPPFLENFGWPLFACTPLVAWLLMRVQDSGTKVLHDWREWLALPLLGLYFTVQSLLFADAFLEEFVLRRNRVFYKTDKTGAQFKAVARPRPVLEVAFEEA